MTREVFSSESGYRLGASARLDAGYRFINTAAIGLHFGVALARTTPDIGDNVPGPIFFPLEIGVGGQIVIGDRALIAPWAGYVDMNPQRYLAAGVELGVDIFVRGRDRISAVATFTRAPGENGISYNSFGAGVAYRYW